MVLSRTAAERLRDIRGGRQVLLLLPDGRDEVPICETDMNEKMYKIWSKYGNNAWHTTSAPALTFDQATAKVNRFREYEATLYRGGRRVAPLYEVRPA